MLVVPETVPLCFGPSRASLRAAKEEAMREAHDLRAGGNVNQIPRLRFFRTWSDVCDCSSILF
ncbi:hypothetical protein BLEM_1013 [Bifidobacterium lemurum]|uniref:Uncharacterized protein n=1 Tax=Bifidobacterium lemurum TaxID=1603886 RepID=A0A261FTI6_9BIFI|nr:hypothetical protein BLEM_1013 [Bifidobacterium lemurum]